MNQLKESTTKLERLLMIKTKEDIKNFRIMTKLTQKEFCKASGLKRSSYACWEAGIRKPERESLDKLNRLYNTFIESKNNKEKSKYVTDVYKKIDRLREIKKQKQFEEKIIDTSFWLFVSGITIMAIAYYWG